MRGSYRENGIVSGGEVLGLEDVELLGTLPANEDRLRGPELCGACPRAEDAASRWSPSSSSSRHLQSWLPEGEIVYPSSSQQVDYEGELGVVIGKRCKNVPADEVGEVHPGLHLLQRCHCPRFAAQRRPVDAGQELRHLCPLWSLDCQDRSLSCRHSDTRQRTR